MRERPNGKMGLIMFTGEKIMDTCEFCKTEGQKTGTCVYCGTVHYTAGVTFIYGQTEKDSYGCEFRLTNKYLIVRDLSNAEMAGNATAAAAFGLIGAFVATAVNSVRKKHYGFYDLRDIQKVIYPYHTKSLKKDTAFKFINKDGSDFILNFNLNGLFSGNAAKKFADLLVKVGVFIENGAGMKYPFCCMKPFVNKATFATRVCQSASMFVKMTNEQFIATPISMEDQTVQQTPIQHSPVIEANLGADATVAWQNAWQTPPIHKEERKVETVLCTVCGSTNSIGVRFCATCGAPLTSSCQPASSVDEWKRKW